MPSEYNIQDLPPANSFCSTHNNGKSLKKWRFTDSKAFPVDWRATCDLFRETELNVRISKRQQPMKCSEQKCSKQSHIDGLPHSPFFFSGKINSFIYYCAAVWNILEFQSSIFPNSPFRGWDSISLPKSNPLSFIYKSSYLLETQYPFLFILHPTSKRPWRSEKLNVSSGSLLSWKQFLQVSYLKTFLFGRVFLCVFLCLGTSVECMWDVGIWGWWNKLVEVILTKSARCPCKRELSLAIWASFWKDKLYN